MSSASNINLLFVCIENSNRSQMAQAFANIHGGEHIKAYSAGSKPSGAISPKAISSMQEIGYDLSVHGSKSLDDLPELNYAVAVTMGCGDACPLVNAERREDWSIPDPKNLQAADFNKVRDLIEYKVKQLLTSL